MKHTVRHYVKSYAVITLGSILYALAYNIFYAPNLVAMGGLTGLGQVLNAIIPVLPVGTTVFVMNVPLFFLGWKYIGGHLLVSSLYAMTFSSFAIDVMDMIYRFPPMDTMLAAIFGGALLGLGIGLVFSKGATTGGTDLIARLLKLKFAWLPMGTLVLIPDFIVIALAAMAFGKVETALYGVRYRLPLHYHQGDGHGALRPGQLQGGLYHQRLLQGDHRCGDGHGPGGHHPPR